MTCQVRTMTKTQADLEALCLPRLDTLWADMRVPVLPVYRAKERWSTGYLRAGYESGKADERERILKLRATTARMGNKRRSSAPCPRKKDEELTLDEAIKHAEEVAERQAGTPCGGQHRQLAEWLKELRDRRGVKVPTPSRDPWWAPYRFWESWKDGRDRALRAYRKRIRETADG